MKQPARIRAAHDIFRTAPAAIDRAPADPSDRSIRTGYYYPVLALLNVRTEPGHCDRPGTSVYRPPSTGGGGAVRGEHQGQGKFKGHAHQTAH